MQASHRVFLVFFVLTVTSQLEAICQESQSELFEKTELLRSLPITEGRVAEDRLIYVRENRRQPDSRVISVSYVRIPAVQGSNLPPVVILPGGPGKSLTMDTVLQRWADTGYSLIAEVAAYSEYRDVVIVNQRGASGTSAGPALPRIWQAPAPDVSKPRSHLEFANRLPVALRKALATCEAEDFDIRGYDIDHLVDDVEAVRLAHGYEKLALRASSFGSQWAFAYLARFPSNVDRLLLSGVEPVDYGYDSADGIWNVVKRVEAELQDAQVAGVPDIGLTAAIKAIVARLKEKPVTVIGQHPRRGYNAKVAIGADDFRHYLLRPILDTQVHSRKMLSYWPKFVAEIYAGDYQYLAAKIIDDRPEVYRQNLLLTLVDNSLGVSVEREKQLAGEQARTWLGDVNWFYSATRSECPVAPNVDALRSTFESDVPALFIQGTFDLATPMENAVDAIERFSNGKLLTVQGGTHAATYHAASADKQFLGYLESFMNSLDPVAALGGIPNEIRLPPLQFKAIEDPSLFQLLTR